MTYDDVLVAKTVTEEDEHGATWALCAATVKLADGSEHEAVVDLCVSDSCEHYGTAIKLPGGAGWVVQGEPDFLKRLGRTAEQVFPYRYRYDAAGRWEDHHIGPDGWSGR